jgi:hypothetical protein
VYNDSWKRHEATRQQVIKQQPNYAVGRQIAERLWPLRMPRLLFYALVLKKLMSSLTPENDS